MKKLIFIVTFFLLFITTVCAKNEADDLTLKDIYNDQVKISGADKLIDEIPEETKNIMEKIEICDIDWKTISELNIDKMFSEVMFIAKSSSYKPFKAILSVIGIMLLYAVLDNMKFSFEDKKLSGVMGAVSVLCICSTIVYPIVKCIHHTSYVIKSSANFMMCYLPVMAGLMISSGQVVSGTSYYFLMVTIGEFIVHLSSGVLCRLLSVFLALSVISSISPKLSLNSICDFINKFVKWLLCFIMSLFTGVLAVKSIVGNAADTVSTKTAKLVVSSFVPIVGGALSDAFDTVQGCVKLLKSSVGAFAILVLVFIFIPIVLECMMWVLSLMLCTSISDVLGLKQISSLLQSSSKVVSTMLVIIVCCATILIISTALVLIVGGITS